MMSPEPVFKELRKTLLEARKLTTNFQILKHMWKTKSTVILYKDSKCSDFYIYQIFSNKIMSLSDILMTCGNGVKEIAVDLSQYFNSENCTI